jgi:hypothetical protein
MDFALPLPAFNLTPLPAMEPTVPPELEPISPLGALLDPAMNKMAQAPVCEDASVSFKDCTLVSVEDGTTTFDIAFNVSVYPHSEPGMPSGPAISGVVCRRIVVNNSALGCEAKEKVATMKTITVEAVEHPSKPGFEYDPELSDEKTAGFCDEHGEQVHVPRHKLPTDHAQYKPLKSEPVKEAEATKRFRELAGIPHKRNFV